MKQSSTKTTTANVTCPRDATRVFSNTVWGPLSPKTFIGKKYRQRTCSIENTTKSVSCNFIDKENNHRYGLQDGQVPTYLVRTIAFTNKCWLPFKALGFLVGDMTPCCHPTHLPVQTPDTKAAERFPLLWVCILYSDVCQEPSVVKTTVGCFGRQAYLKTQRQNLHSCPGDLVFHIFRSGITLLTGLGVSH